MESMLRDLRFGTQMLIRNPGFTLAVLITLGLGIGVNSAIFSVINAVLIQPLPYTDPERLVVLLESNPAIKPEDDRGLVSPANYLDWRRENRVFTDLAAFRLANVTLAESEGPVILQAASVSPALFSVLGVEAGIGRTFTIGPEGTTDEREVVLSHDCFRSRFGGDPAIVGRSLRLNGQLYRVVGVAPAEFRFFRNPEMYVRAAAGIPQFPTGEVEGLAEMRSVRYFNVVGRLKPGTDFAAARAEMETLGARLAAEYPEDNEGRALRLMPLREWLFGKVQPILLLLFEAVGVVLLIACANVVNLLLARATTREREIAIRTAFGANRSRLVRQLVTESLLLSLLGGGLGLLLGAWGVKLLIGLTPGNVPRLDQVELDGWVVGFTVLLSLLVGALIGLVPAARASKTDLQGVLKEGGVKATSGARRRRFHNLLVVSEMALALVLLVGAGLLAKSLLNLYAVEPGFEPQGLLTLRISLPATKYVESSQVVGFYDNVLERFKRLPGVEAAAGVNDLPSSGRTFTSSFVVEGLPQPAEGEDLLAGLHRVTPHYFKTLGIPLLAGRDFDERDREGAASVVVISRGMAERFWPGRDPIGQRIGMGRNEDGNPEWFSIIGVVGDLRYSGLEKEPGWDAFMSFRQFPEGAMSLALRTKGDPMLLASAVREQVLAVDPGQPLDEVRTMEQILALSTADRRFLSFLLALLASVALLLALAGIYSTMSYSVAQRTQEIGIRMALGARRGTMMGMIVREAAVIALIGWGLGLVAAFGLTRLLESRLFGVGTVDPGVFTLVSAGLVLVSLAASYVPAVRAMSVDPTIAMQHE